MPDPNQWYFSTGGERHGPVSTSELRRLADAGTLSPDDLVWREGMREWKPARKAKGLFPAEPPAPAGGPPPLPSVGRKPTPTARTVHEAIRGRLSAITHDSLGKRQRKPAWVMAIIGVGLLVAAIGILCPWYRVEGRAAVDLSGMNEYGMGVQPPGLRGAGGFGYGGGMGRSAASFGVPLAGLDTVPGVAALLPLLAAAGTGYLPWRWASLAAAGAGGLAVLAVLGGLFYTPGVVEASQYAGRPGMDYSSSVAVHVAWGMFLSMLGAVTVVAGSALAFFGVGSRLVGVVRTTRFG